MPIKVKTRKILWSKSGNRCAICKRQLVQKLPIVDDNFIIGEECHIISSKADGPRGQLGNLKDFDTYENLILLCANDHKLVDEFPETFTVEIIKNIKLNHEKWIEEAIEKDLEEYIKVINNAELLEEITHRALIDNILRGSHFNFFDITSISDDKNSLQVSELIDNFRDYTDIYSDLEYSHMNKILMGYMNEIKRFNELGIRFFGKQLIREYKFPNIPNAEYKIAFIVAFEVNANPHSIQNGKLMVRIPENFKLTF